MSQLTPAMDAALSGLSPTVFGAVSITLPSYTLNLLDGAGRLSFGGNTYVARDTTYGVLAACESINDGVGDEAPSLSLTFFPASDAAAADLASPAMQGSAVSIYLGALTPSTGAVIADPLLLFLGELDVPVLRAGASGRELKYKIVGVLERCLADDEGQRLSPGRQRALYASDAGLDDVTGVEQPVYWGVAGDNNGISFPGAYSYGGLPGAIYGALQR